jgi:hypothetical protein
MKAPRCSHHPRRLIIARCLVASAVPAIVVERIVDTDDATRGINVETEASRRTTFGLMCRIYQTATGPRAIPRARKRLWW